MAKWGEKRSSDCNLTSIFWHGKVCEFLVDLIDCGKDRWAWAVMMRLQLPGLMAACLQRDYSSRSHRVRGKRCIEGQLLQAISQRICPWIKELCSVGSTWVLWITNKCILWKRQHLDSAIVRVDTMACLPYPIVKCRDIGSSLSSMLFSCSGLGTSRI